MLFNFPFFNSRQKTKEESHASFHTSTFRHEIRGRGTIRPSIGHGTDAESLHCEQSGTFSDSRHGNKETV